MGAEGVCGGEGLRGGGLRKRGFEEGVCGGWKGGLEGEVQGVQRQERELVCESLFFFGCDTCAR